MIITLASQVCDVCYITCASCTGSSNGQCLSCNSGVTWLLNGYCNSTCNIGFYPDTGSKNPLLYDILGHSFGKEVELRIAFDPLRGNLVRINGPLLGVTFPSFLALHYSYFYH